MKTIFKKGIDATRAIEDLKKIASVAKRQLELIKELSAGFKQYPQEERNILAAIEIDKIMNAIFKKLKAISSGYPEDTPSQLVGLVTIYETLSQLEVDLLHSFINKNSIPSSLEA